MNARLPDLMVVGCWYARDRGVRQDNAHGVFCWAMIKFITCLRPFTTNFQPHLQPFFNDFKFKINKWVSDPVIFNGGPTGIENLGIIACAWNTVHKICDLTCWIYAWFMTNLWPISFLPNLWPFYDFSRMNIKFTGLFLIYDHRIHHVYRIHGLDIEN